MAETWRSAPEWFKAKDYSYLSSLDASGWLLELEKCARLFNDTLARLDGRPDLREDWDWIGKPGWTDNARVAFIGAPAVRIVDKADQASLSDLEKPALIMMVSLRATDHDIIECLKKALRDARRDTPGPASKPGPQALSAKFDKTIFGRWFRHRIVQLCDLAEWRSKLDEKDRPKNADFGRWLFDGRDDYKDKLIFDACQMLKAAINEIPALTLQVEREAEEKRLGRTSRTSKRSPARRRRR
jgi:hypothetical protein